MFDAFETSLRGGKPGHLFIFTRQSLAWRYASGDRDVVIGGNTYLAAPIERSEIKQTIEKPQDQITINFPYVRDPGATELPVTQPLGDNWHPYVPSDVIGVICMAYHANDPDAQALVEWMGRVAQPKFTDGNLELTCKPTGSTDRAQRKGPKWQKACWKTTYSTGPRGCNLVKADFQLAATVTAISGLSITAAEFGTAPLNLAGGAFSWTRADGVVEQRPIMAHSGSTITLLYGGNDLAVGTACTALPDCARTWSACVARNNTINYGGAIYKPIKNPYQGQSMSWG